MFADQAAGGTYRKPCRIWKHDSPRGNLFSLARVAMSLNRRTQLVLACFALAALGCLFAASRRGSGVTIDPRDENATMPDPRGRTLLPDAACLAPTRLARDGPSPRCVVSFARALTTVGLAPGGTLAIAALAHAATVGWTLPAATVTPSVRVAAGCRRGSRHRRRRRSC
jgi:hypothetical protein